MYTTTEPESTWAGDFGYMLISRKLLESTTLFVVAPVAQDSPSSPKWCMKASVG